MEQAICNSWGIWDSYNYKIFCCVRFFNLNGGREYILDKWDNFIKSQIGAKYQAPKPQKLKLNRYKHTITKAERAEHEKR